MGIVLVIEDDLITTVEMASTRQRGEVKLYLADTVMRFKSLRPIGIQYALNGA